MEREILHVNTDDFYASVLRLRDPALRGRAVLVGGAAPRGVVLSASYEARADGVTRGMTVSTAMRLCPRGVFLPPEWGLFRRASHALFAVLGRYSPVVEAASLDEGYIDYTGCGRLFGAALDAGARIKREILGETGLAVSLGVATSKLVSHVASRSAKRAHLVDVYPGYERAFLAPVPIARFPIVGERRAPALRELGIGRVGDVLLFPERLLAACFGSWGRRLHRGAMGEDDAAVRPQRPRDERFTVAETLEPDRVRTRAIEAVLYRMAERLGERLRDERSLAGSLALELVYADGDTARGGARPHAPTSDDLALFEAARRVLSRLYVRRVRVRSLALSGGRIEPEPLQLELFADEGARERTRSLREALDRLRRTFPGPAAPAFGRALAAAGGKPA